MASSPASPLEYNEHTGEPFIRLPHPYKNIILTPPRLSDVAALMAVLNDPKVYLTLEGPPNPYLESDAMAQLARITKECAESLREFHEAEEARRAGDTSRQFVSSHPLRYIREVREDGTDIFLGDLRITRCNYRDIENVAEKARMAEANQAREAGDAEIVWCVADILASSHHGKGIMTAALATVMQRWMIPQMNARLIRVETFEGNMGSVRVFEKNRFVLDETVPVQKVTPSGVHVLAYNILWWRASGSS